MKKTGIALLVLLFLSLISLAYADEIKEDQNTFVLPAGVRIIDDEAFSGTAVETVVLLENVEYIGEKAFSDTEKLSNIYIPSTVEYIADNAFAGPDIVIHGIKGSYASQWAEEHGFRFIHEDIWIPTGGTDNLPKVQPVYLFVGAVSLLSLLVAYLANGLYTRNRKRVKDYPELYAIDLVFP